MEEKSAELSSERQAEGDASFESQAQEEAASGRSRVLTDKAKYYLLEKSKANRSYAKGNVTRQMNKIKPLMSEYRNQEMVREELIVLNTLTTKFQDSHDRYMNELNIESEREDALKWFDSVDQEIFQFKCSVHDFLNEVKVWESQSELGSVRSYRSKRSSIAASLSSSKMKALEAQAKSTD